MLTPEVNDLKRFGYHPSGFIAASPEAARGAGISWSAAGAARASTRSRTNLRTSRPLYGDGRFCRLTCRAQRDLSRLYADDRRRWNRMSLMNIANSRHFLSRPGRERIRPRHLARRARQIDPPAAYVRARRMSADATSARQIELHGSNRNARDHVRQPGHFSQDPRSAPSAPEQAVAFTLTGPGRSSAAPHPICFSTGTANSRPCSRSKNNTSATVWTCSPLRYSRRSQGSISIILTFTPATANYTPGSLARHMLQQATARPGS